MSDTAPTFRGDIRVDPDRAEQLLVENIVLRAKIAKLKALMRDDKRHLIRWIDHSHLVDLDDIKKILDD